MDGMTFKQIAELCGVEKTTVQRWIEKIPDAKRIELDAKCIEAQKAQDPAVFTLPETLAIIRAGGNNTLADLLADNAERRQPDPIPVLDAMTRLVTAISASALTRVEQRQFILSVTGVPISQRKALPGPRRHIPFEEGESRIEYNAPWWPMNSRYLGTHLGLNKKICGEVARGLGIADLENITREQAHRIWAEICKESRS